MRFVYQNMYLSSLSNMFIVGSACRMSANRSAITSGKQDGINDLVLKCKRPYTKFLAEKTNNVIYILLSKLTVFHYMIVNVFKYKLR